MPAQSFDIRQSVVTAFLDRSGSFRGLSAVTLAGGGYVTTFENFGFRFQSYDYIVLRIGAADGSLGPQLEGFAGNLRSDAAIVATPDGGFLISYTAQAYSPSIPQSPGDVYVMKFNADGSQAFASVLVNATPDMFGAGSTAQTMSSVASLSGGNFVTAFTDASLDAGDVRFQLFTSGGVKIGGDRIAHVSTAGVQRNSTVTALADGGFLATWETPDAGGGDAFDIIGRRFDAVGTAVGSEFRVNTTSAGSQTSASVTRLADGSYVVAYISDGAVRFQQFSATFERVGAETTVAASGQTDVIVRDHPDGGFVIGWADQVQGFTAAGVAVGPATAGPGTRFDILPDGSLVAPRVEAAFSATVFTERFVPTPITGATINGADDPTGVRTDDERLFGTPFADVIDARAGNDGVDGLGGDDVLTGGDGNDALRGGTGNDRLRDSAGSDTFDGGEGIDIVDFSATPNGLTIDIAGGNAYTIAQGEALVGIESAVGSAFADVLIGDMGANRLDGGGGDDRIVTGKGGDVVIGGAGTDTVDYLDSNGTVLVNLTLDRGFNNYADSDTYDGIENVIGSNFNDILIGDEGVNTLDGRFGNDLLIGALGADRLIGGADFDTVNYSDSIGTVFINLTLGRGYNNSAEGDTYEGVEAVEGSRFDDFIIGNNLVVNRLDGAGGNDTLIGSLGDVDELIGGDGNDTVSYEDNQGGVFASLASGRGANNAAQGDVYTSVENLRGGLFADFLIGDNGVNRLEGMAGDDILLGGLGADVLIGGAGFDTVSYEDNQGAVFVNLSTRRGNGNAAEGDTYDSIEGIAGSAFYDTFIGDDAANRLNGRAGVDRLTGNGGADDFVFDTALGATNVDTITDFAPGTDRIVLDRDIFFTISLGAFGPNTFITGTQATGGQNRIIYDPATGNLWFDDDGNGTDPAILFAVLENRPALTAADFVVVA